MCNCNKFEMTSEKEVITSEICMKHLDRKGPLMPILQDVQEKFGCVPIPLQKIVSEKTGESVAKINGVVTFYSQFSVEPKGEHVIGVCLGTACYVRGSQQIIDNISKDINIKVGETSSDGKFTLEATRCIGACGLAPVFTVGKDVYGNVSVAESIEAIQKYK